MKNKVHTSSAPAAIGPYSQAIKANQTIYLSGQIALDPKTMTIVSEDFKAQALQVMHNLKEVAIAAGGTLDNIVKLTIYLIDFNDFTILNEIMSQFFTEPYPARATIQVVALPKNVKIEIDGIMHL
jgi:reactive intermediate/imine deaminase